jgi:hypothetical protein
MPRLTAPSRPADPTEQAVRLLLRERLPASADALARNALQRCGPDESEERRQQLHYLLALCLDHQGRQHEAAAHHLRAVQGCVVDVESDCAA